MKRRNFLRSGSLLSLPFILDGMPLAAIGRNAFLDALDADSDRVLVLIQLNGGNDGLQTIIPMEHYDLLANVRSNIILPESSIIEVNNEYGFHPKMEGMKDLFDDDKLCVVQDAGYPNQNRSHFRSTDIWTSGSSADEFVTTGWLGRYFENRHPGYPEGYPNDDEPHPLALSIGSIVSETCQGTISNFSLALTDPLSVGQLNSGVGDQVPETAYGEELAFLRSVIEQSNAYSSAISEAAEKGSADASLYDDSNSLAQQLRNISLLISGGLKTKIYIANIGGFDTHANQVESEDTSIGAHADLLEMLTTGIHAFSTDLKNSGQEERVITMTFSEFGRRIRSNDSLGTDHGTAAPLMVFGPCVNTGILGNTPAIPDNPSQSDGVPMQFDFRDIYGSILMDWFSVSEEEVRELLYPDFTRLPIIQSCQPTPPVKSPPVTSSADTRVFPNPFFDSTRITFNSNGEEIQITIFDSMGSVIKRYQKSYYPRGVHSISFNAIGLAPGNYFYRVRSASAIYTETMVKI